MTKVTKKQLGLLVKEALKEQTNPDMANLRKLKRSLYEAYNTGLQLENSGNPELRRLGKRVLSRLDPVIDMVDSGDFGKVDR